MFNPSADPQHGLLDVKCPISLFDNDLTPEESAASTDFFCKLKDGKVIPSNSHKYYTQVQGQMGITGLLGCDCRVEWARKVVDRTD